MALEVAVVGGGPAGLLAAEVLSAAGATVTVFDRMPSLGRRLQLAGRGGLNLTHSEPLDRFLDRYGPARPVLEPAISSFTPDDLRAWATALGEEPFVGTSGRVFPAGFRATALLRAWLARLGSAGVAFRTRSAWTGWSVDGALRFGTGEEVRPDATVLALGGASWPRVGADGTWVPVLERAGVSVSPLRPANCGLLVDWTDHLLDRFEGQPLKDVELRFGDRAARGDVVVTREGIIGGPVYGLAAAVRDALGPVELQVDLRPSIDLATLTARLATRPTDSTSSRLRRAGLGPIAVGILRESTPELPRAPAELATLVKSVPLRISGTAGLARAISTAGGIALDELDDRFMLRRLPGVFACGEMLDWEAPTGGYLLQACFSTGAAAARGALAWLGR